MEVKKIPDFGCKFDFPENEKWLFEDNVTKVTRNLCVQMAEQYDDAIVAEIAKAARACGVSDCVVLNKKAIIDALMKQVPMKCVREGDDESDYVYCPNCRTPIGSNEFVWEDFYERDWKPIHCVECGQSMVWEVSDGK